MTALDERWGDFRGRLHEVYPEIDPEVVRQVEDAFPGEIELTCWKKEARQVAAEQPAIDNVLL